MLLANGYRVACETASTSDRARKAFDSMLRTPFEDAFAAAHGSTV